MGDDFRFLLAHVETLTQQVAELEADRDSWRELRNTLALPALARAEQAEQQRDAAHAALVEFGAHDPSCSAHLGGKCYCGLDAALAASAPQREEK